jgi:hypothetical protein
MSVTHVWQDMFKSLQIVTFFVLLLPQDFVYYSTDRGKQNFTVTFVSTKLRLPILQSPVYFPIYECDKGFKAKV